jgi:hypothetical protein
VLARSWRARQDGSLKGAGAASFGFKGLETEGGQVEIKKSVGSGGVNEVKDVYLVQVLLNVWRTSNSLPEIAEDGKVGPETIKAIEKFQKTTGWVDGRVDPGGRAMRALKEFARPYLAEALSFVALGIATTYLSTVYSEGLEVGLPATEANLLTMYSFRQ